MMTEQPIGILQQRRIEAAIIKPLVAAFEAELGHEKTQKILAEVIIGLATEQGEQLREETAGDNLKAFAGMLEPWQRGDAMEMEVLTLDEDTFHFNVTRCRYAEMYHELGLADLGYTLSCNRDASLIKGFSEDITFTRTQTIMEGATHCDFRYGRRKE